MRNYGTERKSREGWCLEVNREENEVLHDAVVCVRPLIILVFQSCGTCSHHHVGMVSVNDDAEATMAVIGMKDGAC